MSTVPVLPLEVVIGPLQVPLVSGVPESSLNKSIDAMVLIYLMNSLEHLIPKLAASSITTVTSNLSLLSQGGSVDVAK